MCFAVAAPAAPATAMAAVPTTTRAAWAHHGRFLSTARRDGTSGTSGSPSGLVGFLATAAEEHSTSQHGEVQHDTAQHLHVGLFPPLLFAHVVTWCCMTTSATIWLTCPPIVPAAHHHTIMFESLTDHMAFLRFSTALCAHVCRQTIQQNSAVHHSLYRAVPHCPFGSLGDFQHCRPTCVMDDMHA